MGDKERIEIVQKIERRVSIHKLLAEEAGFDGDRNEFEYQVGIEQGLMIALAMIIPSAACNGCSQVYQTEELKVSTGSLHGTLVCGRCWDDGK